MAERYTLDNFDGSKPPIPPSPPPQEAPVRWTIDQTAEYPSHTVPAVTPIAKPDILDEPIYKAKRKRRRLPWPLRLVKALALLPFRLLKTFIRLWRRKKMFATIVGTIVVLAVIFGAANTLPKIRQQPVVATEVLGNSQTATPDFDTLLPGGDASKTKSGKVAYDKDKKVASYTDAIAGTAITVSQQTLPEPFVKSPMSELEKFAQQINATKKHTIGDITAYSGLSIKGPQTIVFVKSGLLIFIGADKEIADKDLTAYIATLQ